MPEIIDKIRLSTSSQTRAVVVLDAGIATEENCALIKAKGFDYVYVNRAKMKNYKVEEKDKITEITTKSKHKVSLQRAMSEKHTDFKVKVKSEGKQFKKQSMDLKFEDRFLLDIEKVNSACTKKNGIKKTDKVNQRIGRVLENTPR